MVTFGIHSMGGDGDGEDDASAIGIQELHRGGGGAAPAGAGAGAGAIEMDQFNSLGALEIVKESVAVLRRSPPRVRWLAAALALPFSAAALSQAWAAPPAQRRLAGALAGATGLPSILVTQIAHGLVSHLFSLPFYVAFAVPSRAALACWLTLLYSGKQHSLHAAGMSSKQALLIWIRTIVTYLWICFVMLAFVTVFLSVVTLANSIARAAGFSPDVILLLIFIVSLPVSLLFAHLVIVCNLAITVAILEQLQGPESVMKSILLLRGRTQVGLLLFIFSACCVAFVEGLFQYRVVGMPGYQYSIDLSSKLWEMPLLVSMYCFFNLLESITSTVFYFTCKASSCEAIEVFSPAASPALDMDV